MIVSGVGTRTCAGKLRRALQRRQHRGVVLPKKHGQLQLLLFDEPLRGDGYLAPALHFLIGFDDVKRRDGAGLGTAFDLAEAILRHADGAALHFKELHRRHPIPELRGGGEKQILPGLGDPDVRARICEFRSLQFGIFRVRHQPSQKRKEPAEEDLLIAVIEGEIRNLGIADRLSERRPCTEIPRGAGLPPVCH